jgi:hypothetical protein
MFCYIIFNNGDRRRHERIVTQDRESQLYDAGSALGCKFSSAFPADHAKYSFNIEVVEMRPRTGHVLSSRQRPNMKSTLAMSGPLHTGSKMNVCVKGYTDKVWQGPVYMLDSPWMLIDRTVMIHVSRNRGWNFAYIPPARPPSLLPHHFLPKLAKIDEFHLHGLVQVVRLKSSVRRRHVLLLEEPLRSTCRSKL